VQPVSTRGQLKDPQGSLGMQKRGCMINKQSVKRNMRHGSVVALVAGLTATGIVVLMPNLAHAMDRGQGAPGRSGTAGRQLHSNAPGSGLTADDSGVGPSGVVVHQTSRGRTIWFSSTRETLIRDHRFNEADNLVDIAHAIAANSFVSGATVFGFRRTPEGVESAGWIVSDSGFIRMVNGQLVSQTRPSEIASEGWGDFVYNLR
jgi:hypothetical protein